MHPIYGVPCRHQNTRQIHVCTGQWSQESKKPKCLNNIDGEARLTDRMPKTKQNPRTTQWDIIKSWLTSSVIAWTETAGADRTRSAGIAGTSLLPSAPEYVSVQPRTSCDQANSSSRLFLLVSLSLDLSNKKQDTNTTVYKFRAAQQLGLRECHSIPGFSTSRGWN